MTRELVTVDPSIILTEAARAMSAGRAGSALVLQDGSIIGILTERDILRALAESSNADIARVSSFHMDDPRSVDGRPRHFGG